LFNNELIRCRIICKFVRIDYYYLLNYNPKIHNRQSIRLKGYDYSREGLYFITICCQDQAMMFGEIKNGEMYLNDAGRMVEKWYWELENKYPDKKCREMVVMPNHFHCIIENVKTDEYGDDGMDAPPYTSAPPRIDAHVGTSRINRRTWASRTNG